MTTPELPLPATALALCVLIAAPLAGCLEPIGEAVQDQVDDGETPEEGIQADDGARADVEQGEIADTYESAFTSLEPGEDDEVDRVSMDLSATKLETQERFEITAFWDEEERVAAMTFENGTQAEGQARLGSMEGVLIGSVGETTFFGVPPQLATYHDENKTWEDEPFNVSSEETGSRASSQDMLDPASMVDQMEALPEEANVTSSTVTHEGEQARQIQVAHDNETATIDARVLVDPDTERPLLVEGVVNDANTEEGPIDLSMAFTYGDQADHAYADELVRLEAMAVDSGTSSMFGGTSANTTLTVQPSVNPGTIALDAVEVHAFTTSDEGTQAQVQMRLPAEDGRLSTENGELVYEDKDGDGHVSPGDEIRFTPSSDEASRWSVGLYDEETEMRTVPGVGVSALAASLAGLAGLVGRRP